MNARIFAFAAVSLIAFLQIHCAGSQYITPASAPRRNPGQQITDEEIRKAYETKPQLVKPLTIAVYGGGSTVDGFADSLRTINGVSQVFEISPGIIEGDRYYQRRSSRWYSYYSEPELTDLQHLRLIAAQGKADLLVYCGASHVYRQEKNFLSYTYVLLLTAIFVPGMDAELTTDVDLFFIDVRNGFLYGTYHDQEVFQKKFVTLGYEDQMDNVKKNQTDKILPRLTAFTRDLLAHDTMYLKPQP